MTPEEARRILNQPPLVRRCANCGNQIARDSEQMDGTVWFHIPLYWDGTCQDPVPVKRDPPSAPA